MDFSKVDAVLEKVINKINGYNKKGGSRKRRKAKKRTYKRKRLLKYITWEKEQ